MPLLFYFRLFSSGADEGRKRFGKNLNEEEETKQDDKEETISTQRRQTTDRLSPEVNRCKREEKRKPETQLQPFQTFTKNSYRSENLN